MFLLVLEHAVSNRWMSHIRPWCFGCPVMRRLACRSLLVPRHLDQVLLLIWETVWKVLPSDQTHSQHFLLSEEMVSEWDIRFPRRFAKKRSFQICDFPDIETIDFACTLPNQ